LKRHNRIGERRRIGVGRVVREAELSGSSPNPLPGTYRRVGDAFESSSCDAIARIAGTDRADGFIVRKRDDHVVNDAAVIEKRWLHSARFE
jgi:hypothetical protein